MIFILALSLSFGTPHYGCFLGVPIPISIPWETQGDTGVKKGAFSFFAVGECFNTFKKFLCSVLVPYPCQQSHLCIFLKRFYLLIF